MFEAPSIVATVQVDLVFDPVSTLVTIIAMGSSSFTLPPWLTAIIQKRKGEFPSKDYDSNVVVKAKIPKTKKAKVVSRIMVSVDNTEYAEVVEPFVENSAELMQTSDYKFTTIEFGKRSC